MKIIKVISQHRRDFKAVFECEHCHETFVREGYDDTNFHVNVIPLIPCKSCGKTSPDTYIPQEPRYPDWMTV